MIRNGAVVTVTGWLQNVSDFEWGRAVKVAVDVNRKNHQGEWEKVDVTLFDCTTDDRSQYFEGVKQVTVTGRITGTNVFQKRDGSTGFSIKVRADEIRPAIDEKRSEAAVNAVWPTVNPNQSIAESAPF
jgi:single-stranded DNA-binding protein